MCVWSLYMYMCVDFRHAEVAHTVRALKGCEDVDEGPYGHLNYVS